MKLVGSRKAVRSPEFHKKKERQRKVVLFLYSVAFLFFIVSPFFVLRHDSLLIAEIDVSGNEVTEDIEVRNIVSKNLKGKILWLIPKSSALLYPNEKIEEDIRSAIPRIASVNLSLEGTRVLGVEVEERKPDSLYCKDVSIYRESRECYFIDSSGLIYSEAPEFAGGVYLVYTSSLDMGDPIRKQFLPQDEMEGIKSFAQNLKNLSFESKYIVQKQDEFALITTTGTEIRWNADQDLESLYTDLNSFIKESEMSRAKLSELLYIDLRFENKIFYKFEGGEQA